MERLTIEKCGEILIKNNDNEYRSPCFGCESISKCNPQKLSCGFHKALERLKEYEDLEEQGKLLKLPCAVGDTVYCVDPFCNGDDLLCNHRHYYCANCSLKKNNVHERKFSLNMFENFGESVFLTKEEAEAALTELQR